MSEYVFKLPDLGEGTVEAEIVEWHVKVGDKVREGDVICDVMTDKANVEVPAPVDGTVLRTTGEPGDIVAVGSELIALEARGKAAGRGAGRALVVDRPDRPGAFDHVRRRDTRRSDRGCPRRRAGCLSGRALA